MTYGAWGTISVIHDGVVVDADSEACRLLRRRREAIVGADLRNILDAFDRDLENAWEAARTGDGYSGELRLRAGDGTVFLADVEMTSQRAAGGEGTRVAFRDATERKRAESLAHWREEGRYRALVHSASEFIAVQRADSTLFYVSPSVENILGYEPEEMIRTPEAAYVHPEDLEWAWPRFYEILCTPGISEPLPIRYRHKDGTWRHFEVIANNRLDDPDVEGVVYSCRDVTERVRTEEALQEAEERYRMLVEHVPAVSYTLKPSSKALPDGAANGTVAYISPQIERMLGFPPEAFIGDPLFWNSLIHPDDLERVLAEDQRTERSGSSFEMEYRMRHESGRWVWVRDAAVLVRGEDGEPLFWQCVLVDISRHKSDEEEIRRLNEDLERRVQKRTAQLKAAMKEADDSQKILRLHLERFRALVRHASDINVVFDADGTIRYASPAMGSTLGFEPEEKVGTNVLDRVHPEDVGWMKEKLARVLKRPQERASMWYRVCDREGSWRHFEAIATNLLDDPTVGGVILNARDITERRRAEEALRQSEDLYRTVVEQAAENIFIVDVETKRILEANAAFHASLGRSPQEIKEMTLYDVVAHDRESIDKNIEHIMAEGRRFIGERKYRRKDGTLMDVEVSVSVISYGDGKAMCVVAHDITERKRAEDNFRHSLAVLLALYEAGQVMVSSLDLEEIGPRLLGIMRRVANLTAAVICLQDEHGELRVRYAIGPEEAWRRARKTPEAREACRLAREGQPGSFRLDLRDPDAVLPAGLYLPLRVLDRPIGVLEAYGPVSLTDRAAVEVLTSLAGQAGSALENARLYGELAAREKQLEVLVGKLIEAQEEERRRVAYEVHDGLTQVAVSAHQRLQGFAARYVPASQRDAGDLERILGLVRRTVGEARKIIAGLRPTVLDDFGLAAVLRQKVEELCDDGWDVEYEEDLGDERLPITVETALYRIAQEALTNVRKHAQTNWARLELVRRDGAVVLEIEDRGKGFDPETLDVGRGPGERVGLSGMRERVAMVSGEIEVRSHPGEGTSITVRVPLPGQAGYTLGDGEASDRGGR